MDPTLMNTAARVGSGALGALRQPKIRVVRIGSRDERRDVYTRFATAAIAQLYARVERVNHCRMLMAEGRSLAEASIQLRRDYGVYLRQAHEEYMHAQFEVELAGTEEALGVAQRVMTALLRAQALGLEATDDEISAVSSETERAINEFIQICRVELWYATRWWHLHRHAARVGRWLYQPVARRLARLRSRSSPSEITASGRPEAAERR
jgi:hypothetical protein